MRVCIETGWIGSARCFVPHGKHRLRRERGLVICCACRAGFVGHNAAHTNDEKAARRERHLLLEARRAKPELAQPVCAATQDRRVIFASPERSYTAIACEREK